MFKKRITRDPICLVCKGGEETIEHLFLLCAWTTPIWFGLQICHVSTIVNTSIMVKWLDQFLDLATQTM